MRINNSSFVRPMSGKERKRLRSFIDEALPGYQFIPAAIIMMFTTAGLAAITTVVVKLPGHVQLLLLCLYVAMGAFAGLLWIRRSSRTHTLSDGEFDLRKKEVVCESFHVLEAYQSREEHPTLWLKVGLHSYIYLTGDYVEEDATTPRSEIEVSYSPKSRHVLAVNFYGEPIRPINFLPTVLTEELNQETLVDGSIIVLREGEPA